MLSVREHYDRLAALGQGWNDPPVLQAYMARWDGPPFWALLGELTEKDVLEVGIGAGRLAQDVLRRGCRSLTGLDISPLSVSATQQALRAYPNFHTVVGDICDFRLENGFDVVYSVLTLMHVKAKNRALANIAASLRIDGYVVLSLAHTSSQLDFGDWQVSLFPWIVSEAQYGAALRAVGLCMTDCVPLIDNWVASDGEPSETYGEQIATLIKARRV